jgi:hypothetical protein
MSNDSNGAVRTKEEKDGLDGNRTSDIELIRQDMALFSHDGRYSTVVNRITRPDIHPITKLLPYLFLLIYIHPNLPNILKVFLCPKS